MAWTATHRESARGEAVHWLRTDATGRVERYHLRSPSYHNWPAVALSEHSGGHRDTRRVALDLGQCVFCGRCADDPWAGAVSIGGDFELAARSRDDLRLYIVADGPDDQAVPSEGPGTGKGHDAEAARVAAEIHRVLGRSLHLRHLGSGSCNACDWELSALLNPVYDVRRLGIDFVASPRHADGIAITGSVTRNLETAVRRTLEAIPGPRLVIAVGACAISGGIAGRGYASAGGVDHVLPVDVYIPGCPPRPEAIIFGILVALRRLEARSKSSIKGSGIEAQPPECSALET